MEAMFLLIVISVVFVVAIGAAFWWAIFAGQFDNSDTNASSILHDSEADPGFEPSKEPAAGNDQAVQNRDSSNGNGEAPQAKTPR